MVLFRYVSDKPVGIVNILFLLFVDVIVRLLDVSRKRWVIVCIRLIIVLPLVGRCWSAALPTTVSQRRQGRISRTDI